MDTELARTFLAVVECGSFNKAAERINVTQSTVSMRIKVLEDLLGQSVFVRNRAGSALTPAGSLFRRYAENLVRTWQQAKQEIGLSSGYGRLLTVGGQFTLWESVLLKWIPWIKSAVPDLAIRAEVGLSDGLMHRLIDGFIDIAVMYEPQSRPGFTIEDFLDENVILVATRPGSQAPFEPGYVNVDWGHEFQVGHSRAFPDLDTPSLWVSHGPLGLSHILENGGSGYFPLRLVGPYLADGRLHRVENRPEFSRPAYLVYPSDGSDPRLQTALQGLRYVVSLDPDCG